jgi:transposase
MSETIDTRSYSDETLAVLRRLAVEARQPGYSNQQVAEILPLRRETVSRWWSAYQQQGAPGLPGQRSGRPPGVGRILTPEQEREVQERIVGQTPEQAGVAAAAWTRRAVQELIRQCCDIHLPIRTAGLYLARWNFTPQRPQTHSREQDADEVDEWLEEEFPAIQRQGEREEAALHFADETGVALQDQGGRSYAPRGQTPTREVSGARGRVNVLSSISASGELFFLLFSGTLTGPRFVGFLAALAEFAGDKVLLVVDRHPAHTSAEVEAWLAEHADEIELFYLPRYSPELNPDEYLNNDLKQTLDQAPLAGAVSQLRETIADFLNRLTELPEHVASYFQHPQVEYARAYN